MRSILRLLFLIPAAAFALLTQLHHHASADDRLSRHRSQTEGSDKGAGCSFALETKRLRDGRRSLPDGRCGLGWTAEQTHAERSLHDLQQDREQALRLLWLSRPGRPGRARRRERECLRAVTLVIRWASGVNLRPPTVFIRALSIHTRAPMAVSDCMVKLHPSFCSGPNWHSGEHCRDAAGRCDRRANSDPGG